VKRGMLSEAQDLLAVMFKRNVQPDSGMLVQVRGLGFRVWGLDSGLLVQVCG
jgi:hypothetical protein